MEGGHCLAHRLTHTRTLTHTLLIHIHTSTHISGGTNGVSHRIQGALPHTKHGGKILNSLAKNEPYMKSTYAVECYKTCLPLAAEAV